MSKISTSKDGAKGLRQDKKRAFALGGRKDRNEAMDKSYLRGI